MNVEGFTMTQNSEVREGERRGGLINKVWGKKSCYSYHGQRLNPLLYKKLLETEKKKINNAKEKNMKFNKPCLNT